jgi:LmbE family N-acetylglucosaminyl deacetylase
VQDRSNPCEKADIVVFSAHADDEQLFFGGLIAYYAGEVQAEVQVVYLVQYWTGPYADLRRNHEALNGLWTIGVKNYPVVGEFEDYYSRERGEDKSPALAHSESQYDVEAVLGFVVEQLRRFKPHVAVGHDLINGEMVMVLICCLPRSW